ncbi:MAG: hypothetical protein JWN76_27 [Chitinophagaceae bacterium]|nr:hypothetical protein [Chitinophagaceae bacterium]
MSSIYAINKSVNKPVEFKGLKGQYIWWFGIGLAVLLLLFALLYISGVNVMICLLLVFVIGAALFRQVYQMSGKYGEHGMMKKMAGKYIPKVIKCEGRFI